MPSKASIQNRLDTTFKDPGRHFIVTQVLRFLEHSSPTQKYRLIESLLFTLSIKAELFLDKRLTPQEQACLRLASRDYSVSQTATELNISKDAVKAHRKQINKKLGCKRIAGAVMEGIRLGYFPPHKKVSD